MIDFNYENLTLARQYHGLSQKDLASLVDIAQSSLSKIEKGQLIPSDETMSKLVSHLGFTTKFYESKNANVSALSFHGYRKQASVPISKVNKILSEIIIKTSHQNFIKNYFPNKSIDFSYYESLSSSELAKTIRTEWQVDNRPIDDLTLHIENMGIDIFLCDFEEAQVDGVTSKSIEGYKGIFINKNQPGDRYRFSLAHELCHYLKHSSEPICTREMEDEANDFAAELLMPTEALKDKLKTTRLNDYAALKKEWKVSMAALIFRAKTLGTITPNQSTNLWKQMAMHGFRRVEPFPIEIEEPKRIYEAFSSLAYDDLLLELNLTSEMFQMLYKDFYSTGVKTLSG